MVNVPEECEQVDDQTTPPIMGKVNKRNSGQDYIGRKEVVPAWGECVSDGCGWTVAIQNINLRIREEARSSHPPDPQVPRIKI